MSAFMLLNLFKNVEVKIIWEALLNIVSIFHNKFNKVNETGEQMLDPIYYMILKLLRRIIFFT